jgi:hypothetical protein
MKAKFKIGDENYEFKEITLKKYYELRELLNNPIKGSEYQLVELMTDCPVSVLKKLKMNEWLIVWDEAIYRITQINGNTESIQPWIEFKNVKYALPAVEEMTIGEFVDLDVITSKGDDKYLAEIAAIVYRPVIKEYKGKLYVEDYDADKSAQRVEEFRDMPLSAIKSANSFFLQYVNSSLKNTVESLMQSEELKKMDPNVREVYQNFLQQGLGGELSTPLLEKILSDFLTQRDSLSVQRLTGYRGEKTKLSKKPWRFKKQTK